MQMNLFNNCAQCGDEHPATVSWPEVEHVGRSTKQYHFCTQSCQQHFAQAKMRRLEGNNESTRTGLLADIARRLDQ